MGSRDPSAFRPFIPHEDSKQISATLSPSRWMQNNDVHQIQMWKWVKIGIVMDIFGVHIDFNGDGHTHFISPLLCGCGPSPRGEMGVNIFIYFCPPPTCSSDTALRVISRRLIIHHDVSCGCSHDMNTFQKLH